MNYVKKSKVFYLISIICFVSVSALCVLDVNQNTVRENQFNPADSDPAPSVVKLVVTGADWCGPCKKLDPILAALKKEGYSIEKKTNNNPNHPVPRLQWFRFKTDLERTEYGALSKKEITKIFEEIESKVFR
jgi:thiol-disulfide isomerase/thioredoxin